MKKIVLITTLLLAFTSIYAQNAAQARKVLDKTAAVVGNKNGAFANFTLNNKYGKTNGTIAIKGNKFVASTPDATMWFDGKTQWTYMKKNEEVNVTSPDVAQQQNMNPYTFISLYRNGYTLAIKTVGSNYQVHLTATSENRPVKEMYILINKSTYKPSQVKMRQTNGWTTISIRNFQAKTLTDAAFRFNAKDYPHAEVIDLR